MKESAYNLCARDAKSNYYLYNTRRGTIFTLTAAAYKAYWAATSGLCSLGEAAHTLRALIDNGFLVDNDTDERSEILSAHARAQHDRDHLNLLIAPIMACNLDCFYCFETNRYALRMSQETQRNIVRLVRRAFESGAKRLSVTWYGGEPLLAISAVEGLSVRLLALCEELKRDYAATIVTNGTLLTREKAQRLASWKVKQAQITLDGVPELHDARRIPKSGAPTFDGILQGIEAATTCMNVSVRINVCRKVADRLEELLQILVTRGLHNAISVYVAPLQSMPGRRAPLARLARESASAPLTQHSEPIELLEGREMADLELRFRDLLSKYGFPNVTRLPPPRLTTCMADQEHGWLIEANGDVQKCYWTAGIGSEAVGRLSSSGIVFQPPHEKWRNWTASRNPACLQCVMLPICLGRCPLRHLNNEFDCCPPFKHDWIGFVAQAAGVARRDLIPIALPLAGERIRAQTARGLEQSSAEAV